MRKLAVAVVLAAVMFGGMGTGVAFADHGNGSWEDATGHTDGGVGVPPVGSHLVSSTAPGHPGFVNGFGNVNSNAGDAIANNPNCPLHWATD